MRWRSLTGLRSRPDCRGGGTRKLPSQPHMTGVGVEWKFQPQTWPWPLGAVYCHQRHASGDAAGVASFSKPSLVAEEDETDKSPTAGGIVDLDPTTMQLHDRRGDGEPEACPLRAALVQPAEAFQRYAASVWGNAGPMITHRAFRARPRHDLDRSPWRCVGHSILDEIPECTANCLGVPGNNGCARIAEYDRASMRHGERRQLSGYIGRNRAKVRASVRVEFQRGGLGQIEHL